MYHVSHAGFVLSFQSPIFVRLRPICFHLPYLDHRPFKGDTFAITSTGFTGWWYTYPSEKYESVGIMKFPIYGNIRNVPNHQPASIS